MTTLSAITNMLKSDTLPRLRQRLRKECGSLPRQFRPRLWFWSACARLLPEFTLPTLRAHFYRLGGCDIARGVAILGRLRLLGEGDIAARLHVGEGCLIAPGVTFGLDAEITLGRRVSVSPQATLYTATHSLGFGSRRMNPAVAPKPICVEDGAWVGMQSLILPGQTLGHGCVVSAGSVVTQNVPPDTLVAGNPAATLQSLPFGNR